MGVAERRQRLGSTFREGGRRYDDLRPSYPVDAVVAAVGEGPSRVVDVGAGTGKLTGVLLGLGHEVTAVEPSTDMLARLRESYPQVEAVEGTGEATGLPDACADVVTYGQAWHWADPEAASVEAARLLRPGGRLALLWNFMDLSTPWVATLNEVMHSMDGGYEPRAESASQVSEDWFEAPEHLQLPWTMRVTAEALARLVTTRSYYLALDEAGRAMLAARVRKHVAQVLGGADERQVEVPHVTEVYRFDVRRR